MLFQIDQRCRRTNYSKIYLYEMMKKKKLSWLTWPKPILFVHCTDAGKKKNLQTAAKQYVTAIIIIIYSSGKNDSLPHGRGKWANTDQFDGAKTIKCTFSAPLSCKRGKPRNIIVSITPIISIARVIYPL